MGKYEKAVEYHTQHLKLATSVNDLEQKGLASGNLGRSHQIRSNERNFIHNRLLNLTVFTVLIIAVSSLPAKQSFQIIIFRAFFHLIHQLIANLPADRRNLLIIDHTRPTQNPIYPRTTSNA